MGFECQAKRLAREPYRKQKYFHGGIVSEGGDASYALMGMGKMTRKQRANNSEIQTPDNSIKQQQQQRQRFADIKEFSAYIKGHKKALALLACGASLLSAANVFAAPYLMNALLHGSVIPAPYLAGSLAVSLAGLALMLAFLFAFRAFVCPGASRRFALSLLVMALGIAAVSQAVSFGTGLFAVLAYAHLPIRFDYVKSVIDLFAALVASLLSPAALWCFAGVVFKRTLGEGLLESVKTLRYGYGRILALAAPLFAALYLLGLLGNSLSALAVKCALFAAASVLLIAWTAHSFHLSLRRQRALVQDGYQDKQCPPGNAREKQCPGGKARTKKESQGRKNFGAGKRERAVASGE